jgi:EmrB/QacA subfamily drug resistance transporter
MGERSTTEQRWALALSSVGSFVVVLDMLVVATALSAIQRDLGASLESLEWTLNAYTLSFAVLLMTAATLGDRFGRRRLFAAGLGLFAVASAACALAPSAGTLIAARAVQGVGAAMIMPLALGLLNGAFPPERRGWATGIYGSVTGLAAVLGPILGGAVTEGIAWQWIFWLNVPIGVIAIPLVLTRIKEGYGTAAALDLPGLILIAAAALGLVWGLVRADAAGWGSAEIVSSLTVGVLLTAGFVGWETRTRAPMLPMRLFGSREFSAGNGVIFFLNATMTGSIFLTAQFEQVSLGHGALGAGLRLLPWGVAPFLIAPRAGALSDRFGERPLVVAGTFLQAAGTAWLALIAAPDVSYPEMVAPMTITGAGFSLAVPAVTKAVVSLVTPADIGRASGTFSTLRQLGGAFGVAIPGAVFAATGGYASARAFSNGYGPALGVCAAIAIAGTIAGLAIPKRRPTVTDLSQPSAMVAIEPATVEAQKPPL